MIGELTKAQKARRENILNAATAYFARVGFYAADLDKIAKDAGVGKGTLYNYFKNKDDLYLNCIEHHFEQTLSFIDSKTAQSNSIEAFVNNYINASIEYFSTNMDSFDLIIRSNSSLLDEVVDRMDAVKEKYYRNFKLKLESATSEKKLNPQIVVLALDAATTFIMFRQFKKQKFEINEIEETLSKLFLTGLLNSK